MKIGEMLGLKDNPFYDLYGSNRNSIAGAFSGAAATPGDPWGGAAQGAQRGGMLDEITANKKADEAKRQEQINATAQFLRSKGAEDLAAAVEGGMTTGSDAFNQWYAQANAPAGGASAPSNVQEWQYYSQLSPEEQSQYLNMKRSNTPLNIGTGFVTQDQANPGSIIGAPIAINNEGKAFDSAYGAATGGAAGENAVLADSVEAKMPGLRSVIDDLTNLADTATYTMSGQAMDTVKRELGLDVGQGAIDRATYIAVVDNQVLPLLKDTFGAAFTVQEGESLRATLGDPNKSPQEKKAILNAFISQKERDLAAMKQQGGQRSAPGGATSSGVQWSIE